jgi:hypothetical protein
MKTILMIVLLVFCLTGAGCSSDFRPNTQKGHHLDEINKHTKQIRRLDPIIYEVNEELLPEKQRQLNDQSAWQSRMAAVLKQSKESSR